MSTTVATIFRVIAITMQGFSPVTVTERVKWIGNSPLELSRQFPPSEVWGADALAHREIEDGYFIYDYRFEALQPDGTWTEIDDPRERITPVTSLEREIDAENRRLFPGDYM